MTQDKLTALHSQLTQIQKQIDALKAGGVWEPKEGENYYAITTEGDVVNIRHDGDDYDSGVISIGNVFRTKQEAEKEAKRREITWKLKKLSGGFESVSHDHGYVIIYCKLINVWKVAEADNHYFPSNIYFPTRESAQDAIAMLGDDLNYLL